MASTPLARMGLTPRIQLDSGTRCLRTAGRIPTWQHIPPSPVVGARTATVLRKASNKPEISPTVQAKARQAMLNVTALAPQALNILVPGTFILPPFSELPKGFGNKLRFLWQWLLIKVQEIAMNSSTKYASKPSFFRRAQLRVSRRTLIPTAKALHRTMAQALASGDKDTLYRICSQKLSQSLCSSIDTRPRGRSYGWELVKYTNPLFYPSIRSHRLSPLGMSKEDPIVRQVVVAISSRQRRVAYDSKGQVVPGSEKEIDVVENVAMGCIIDPKTWQQSEWRLIGTVKSTTPGEWQREKKLMTRLMKDS